MWCSPNKYYPSVLHYAKENILHNNQVKEWRLKRGLLWTIYGDKKEIVLFPILKNKMYYEHTFLHEDGDMGFSKNLTPYENINCPIYILTNACDKKSEWRDKALNHFRTKARSFDIETGMVFTFYGVPFLIKKYIKSFGYQCKNIRTNRMVIVSTFDIRTKGEFLKKDNV